MSAPAQPAAHHSFAFLLAVLVLAAAGFALHNVFSRVAYDHGSNPITVLTARSLTGIAVFGAIFAWLRQAPRLPRANWKPFAIVALANFLLGIGALTAFAYIPVSQAILILYLFPILALLLAWTVGHERLTRLRIALAICGFVGVALVINPVDITLDWRGIALALLAAASLAVTVVGAAYVMRTGHPLAVPFNILVWTLPLYLAALAILGGPAWPRDAVGWWGFAGVMVATPLALCGFYWALAHAGPGRASLVMNSEPLLTLAFAYLILSETLNALQSAGAALIVGAILALALFDRRAGY
jgi:drug/metabolite transporter (DMT)-like permease